MTAALVVRLLLLFFPQNNWFTDAPSPWKIYRNLPFLIQGIGVVVLFLRHASALPQPGARLMRYTAYAIVVSFLCYAATVVGTYWHPAWGAMMLPKTWAYMLAAWWLFRLEFSAGARAG